MTRQVLFNGAVLIRAGGATKIDASAFQNLGLGGVGNVGLLGEADAGEPNAVTLFRTPQAMVEEYVSGALADAADLAFLPMNDTRVPGGANLVLACKVNQATQSAATLLKGTADMMALTSKGYGVDTLKISYQIATSGGGKTIELIQEVGTSDPVTETSPVLGASAELTVEYTGAGTAATMTVSPTQITTAVTGGPGSEDLTIPFTTYGTLSEIITFINNSAGGAYTATAVTNNPFGIGGADLDRVTAIDIKTSAASFYAKLYRMIAWVNANSSLVTAERSDSTATGATSGAVTGTNNATFNLEPGQTLLIDVDAGGAATATFDAAAATVTGSGATYAAMTGLTMVFEANNDGDTQTVTFTAAAVDAATAIAEINAQARGLSAEEATGEVKLTSDVRGTSSEIDIQSGTGLTALGLSVAVSSGTGDVANINAVTHAEAKAVIEADVAGLTYTPISGSGTPAVLTSDTTGASSSIQVTGGTAQTAFGFDGVLHSGTAAGSAGGADVPDDVGPSFLTGGTRGTSNNTNWADGADLLGKVRCNEVVPLISEDLANEGYGSTATFAAIAADIDAHAAWFSSTKGKSERQAYVGMKGTKTELITQAGNLQSPHTVLTGQQITRANAASNLTVFPEWGLAVCMAGGRAGSLLGEPLVYKNIRASGLTQDASWTPEDDAEDLILAGVTVAYAPPNKGYKFDRVVTTYTKLDNDAFVEESVVMGWKNVAYELRTQLEDLYTGVRGTPGSVADIRGSAGVILESLRQEEQIVDSILEDGTTLKAYRELTVVLDGDKARVSVVVSPVSGINFMLHTLFLVPAVIAA